ncbi:hypothetical protein LEP1GSC035_3417 [Leptospira noguchii str. 2007001578]|uniref:Uncharacterized protein n=1 Tax=Leptospira noguchii str. 2007001578 TaxID=1049974 RepID=A0ABP2TF07_9LEPT|nr:hypothetical protein LEP1GSC035_3417 [Leptospira noguchii str. 2007001578]
MKFSKTASIYNFNTMKIDGEFIFQELYCIWISRQLKDEIKEPEFRRVNVGCRKKRSAFQRMRNCIIPHEFFIRKKLVKGQNLAA